MSEPSTTPQAPVMPDAEFWKRKLAAFLHDPPEKAFDYGPHHVERAKIYAQNLGIDLAEWLRGNDKADWSAAAADRFLFPTTRLGGAPAFQHPLSPRQLIPLLTVADFPDQATTEDIVGNVLPAMKSNDATTFLRVWRNWLRAVIENGAEKRGAEWIGCLPADTRIPDATIWHHTAITSALEATRGDDGRLHPAFLLVQLGPVQEFIAQARSTRDLWSGSYLISWLMMHAILAVADEPGPGPDNLVFPSLRGQPLYDWLKRESLAIVDHKHDHEAILVPNLPNRFLAVVRNDFDPTTIVKAIKREWLKIANTCRDWLAQKSGTPVSTELAALWDEQVGTDADSSPLSFWQVQWALHPWESASEALAALDGIPSDCAVTLETELDVARAVPSDEVDGRCLHNGQPNCGWAWNAHFERAAHMLDARRSLRDFVARPSRVRSLAKDQFDGNLEAITGTHPDQIKPWDHAALRHLFRNEDTLAAPNLIKRVWHTAYLAEKQGLHRARASFDSVPAISAAPFAAWLRSATVSAGPLRDAFLEFMQAASLARDDFSETIARWESDENAWFCGTDASAFHTGSWDRAITDERDDASRARLRDAARKLRTLLEKAGRAPSRYYSVLALDGDEMGKWVSGKKAPPLREVLIPSAVAYYEKTPAGRAWLDLARRLSPSYHLQFSEALANFALFAARRIVEDKHLGQLIYAGGDDVLAMVPSDEALSCARHLRMAFQGDEKLADACPELFVTTKPGFIRLRDSRGHEPSWPLLVPGHRATVSVGIATAHIKEPLQDVVNEARLAEKRAKQRPLRREFDRGKNKFDDEYATGLNRDAVALSLFKRSGETIHWGAKFDSPAWRVLDLLRLHYRTDSTDPNNSAAIGRRFPYRLAQLLSVYGAGARLDATLEAIATKELEHIVRQQCADPMTKMWPRNEFTAACSDHLRELRDFSFEEEIDGRKVVVEAPRRLADFTALFLTEAFIARHED